LISGQSVAASGGDDDDDDTMMTVMEGKKRHWANRTPVQYSVLLAENIQTTGMLNSNDITNNLN